MTNSQRHSSIESRLWDRLCQLTNDGATPLVKDQFCEMVREVVDAQAKEVSDFVKNHPTTKQVDANFKAMERYFKEVRPDDVARSDVTEAYAALEKVLATTNFNRHREGIYPSIARIRPDGMMEAIPDCDFYRRK